MFRDMIYLNFKYLIIIGLLLLLISTTSFTLYQLYLFNSLNIYIPNVLDLESFLFIFLLHLSITLFFRRDCRTANITVLREDPS